MDAQTAYEECSRREAPVLFLDSSSVLDLAQIPMRGTIEDLRAARRILADVRAEPPGCTTVASSLVRGEVTRRLNGVRQEVVAFVRKAVSSSRTLADACAELNLGSGTEHVATPQVELCSALEGISRACLESSIELEESDEALRAALRRIAARRAPSSAGKQTADVHVIEAYLDLASRLRAGGFRGNMIFLTSNKGDYCDDSRAPHEDLRPLHQDLRESFSVAGLRFSTDFSWAIRELRRPVS